MDTDPLAHLEFLHRIADVLEDFLGSPLLSQKIETSYDVIAQLLGEMCDGGTVATTEPNALREVVEAPSWMNKLLGGVGLPSASPSLTPSSSGALSSFSSLPRPGLNSSASNPNNIAIPWRRNNVRHTSNELYVDLIETLHVTLSPSGRPLSAFAHGTIAFTSKVSGVPDLLLALTAPGGSHSLGSILRLPVFHPCVRLARWKEKPGELSFVPPDGRFLLAGYEVDLLGPDYLEHAVANPKSGVNLNIPASVDVRSGLGPTGSDFEVRLLLDPKFASKGSSSAGKDAFTKPTGFNTKVGGTSAHPIVEDILVRIPIAAGVRNLSELRPTRGEAHYSPGDASVEWRIAGKDAAALIGSLHTSGRGVVATLRCTVVGASDASDDESGAGLEIKAETWEYDDTSGAYQSGKVDEESVVDEKSSLDRSAKRIRSNRTLMPGSASISFQVKGWLASGVKVDKLVVDTQRSRGLGAGVQPYKGVKYLTVSKEGVEVRC